MGYGLRLIGGVSLSSGTYGDDTYGSGTYGQESNVPAAAVAYAVLVLPDGNQAVPMRTYVRTDTSPSFRCKIASRDAVMDLSLLESALLVLTNVGRPVTEEYVFPMVRTGNVLERTWEAGDLDRPGVYRAVVQVEFSGGRQLTVPNDDLLGVRIIATGGAS